MTHALLGHLEIGMRGFIRCRTLKGVSCSLFGSLT